MCSIVTEVDCMCSNHTPLGCARLIFCVCPISIISVSIFLSVSTISFSLFCLYIFSLFCLFTVFSFISLFSFFATFVFLCSLSPVTSVTVLLYALDKGRVKLLSGVRGGALLCESEGRGFDGAIGIFH